MSLPATELAVATAPPSALVAPQGEPPVPTYVHETLDGLKELLWHIIGYLEKMADKLNNIELRDERLERTVVPELPHHPSVPLDLRAQSDEDEDDDE